ncbi:hypothetical protein MWN33_01600 [Starkeya koreensis]|uniref:Uncharacterized protein n=1 Tax=Ancylobacter koreensis TaxID=266121 RepID=A0ABT0DHF2_9HYPH|nr:hypothetical protein [Ancylobacter koreensis]MCK0206721.1 hypothetical protein [Ancylobacter koreensis]
MPAPPLPSRPPRRRLLLAVPAFLFRLVCALVIILDELVRPIYRPLLARLAALRLMQAFERRVARLHPFAVLALLVIPYALVEPLKFVGLVWIANGWEKRGTLLFLCAYLVSFVVIERIFTAGRSQLMTIGWMAWVIDTGVAVRRRIYDRLHLDAIKRRIARQVRRLRARLRALRR